VILISSNPKEGDVEKEADNTNMNLTDTKTWLKIN